MTLQELQSEVENLRSSAGSGTGNGPVDVPNASDGGVAEAEELAKAVGERDELKEQVKELERKLEDIKTKNNVCTEERRRGRYMTDLIDSVSLHVAQSLRDSCWKAKDEAAELEKACEQKLKAAHIETEQRCKAVKTETVTKAREEQQAFLTQLFPSITVDATEFSKWMDEFEVKVEEVMKENRDKVRHLLRFFYLIQDTIVSGDSNLRI